MNCCYNKKDYRMYPRKDTDSVGSRDEDKNVDICLPSYIAIFKNSCLIFSIYIMLIRVDKISSGRCLLLDPFPDIVDTEPFYFSSKTPNIFSEEEKINLEN